MGVSKSPIPNSAKVRKQKSGKNGSCSTSRLKGSPNQRLNIDSAILENGHATSLGLIRKLSWRLKGEYGDEMRLEIGLEPTATPLPFSGTLRNITTWHFWDLGCFDSLPITSKTEPPSR